MKHTGLYLLIVVIVTSCASDRNERLTTLETEIAELKTALAPVIAKAAREQQVDQQRKRARERMRTDAQIYSPKELKEIEALYQVANKKWRSEEGKESLKKLIAQYERANRTGCAMLYLGQMSKDNERVQYLKHAIDDFSDCYYGDGVQVGAYARFYLANHYKRAGETQAAHDLYSEIKRDYPNAIDHRGNPLSEQMPTE